MKYCMTNKKKLHFNTADHSLFGFGKEFGEGLSLHWNRVVDDEFDTVADSQRKGTPFCHLP